MIEENEFWSIATRKNETFVSLYNTFIVNVRAYFLFLFRASLFSFSRHFNEGDFEDDVGAIPKSS